MVEQPYINDLSIKACQWTPTVIEIDVPTGETNQYVHIVHHGQKNSQISNLLHEIFFECGTLIIQAHIRAELLLDETTFLCSTRDTYNLSGTFDATQLYDDAADGSGCTRDYEGFACLQFGDGE